jgi:hypothetical protein
MATTASFSNQSINGISFTGISASETDVNAVGVAPFLPASQASTGMSSFGSMTYSDLTWGALNAGVGAPGSSMTITFNFTATDANAGKGLQGLLLSVANDQLVGPGISFTGMIQAYNGTVLVGQASINDANPSTPNLTNYAGAGDFAQTQAYSSLNYSVTLSFVDAATAPLTSYDLFSAVTFGVGEGALAAPALTTITSVVFNDTNGNGVLDTGETGISGVTVQLLDSTNTVIATTVTDATGRYTFTEPTGTYTVHVVPTGYTISPTPGGSAAGSGAGGPGSTNYVNPGTASSTVNVVGGQSGATVYTPLYTPGAITGVAFLDSNADGVKNTGDTTLSGVTVSLYDSAGIRAQTTTDANGNYSFTGLPPGTGYYVAFTQPNGDVFTTQTAETTANPDASIVNATTGKSGTITVTSGQTVAHVDAGLVVQTGSITSYVWLDANADGLRTGTEVGISGVTVSLYNAAGTAVVATTTTNAAGQYTFSNLAPGTYNLVAFPPGGDAVTTQNVGGAADATFNSAYFASGGMAFSLNVQVAAGQVNNTENLGLYVPGAVSGIAFLDSNHDGYLGTGETGVSGVTVTLYNGTTAVATTTSGTGGAYSFTGVAPGANYSVKFGLPTGDAFTTQTTATSGSPDASLVNATTGQTGTFTVASGQTVTHVDAGVYVPAAITGVAFLDSNKDGYLGTGETGISGVTVTLYSGTTAVATTTSGAGGAYSFTGVTPGANYSVKFGLPTGDAFTTQTTATTASPDASLVNATTGQTGTFTVASGQTVTHVDAGVYVPAAITGVAFLDSNKDGYLGSGETGISGVTMTLYSGTTAVATTTSGAGGAYSFTGVTPGANYSVKFGVPAGDTFTTQATPTSSALDASLVNATSGQTAAFTVSSGQTVTHVDAGYVANTGSISSYVWLDADADGLRTGSEVGVSGVTVALYNAAGTAVVATTTTNAAGQYTFSNLAPGTYNLVVYPPGGDVLTTQNVGGTADATFNSAFFASGGLAFSLNVPVVAGQVNNTENAGLYVPACVSGIAFFDVNNNGVLNTNDTGISGVTVTLYNGTTAVATTTSGAGGAYSFTGVTPGANYSVKFSTPAGDMFTTQTAETASAPDASLANAATGQTASFTVSSGQSVQHIDAGYIATPGSVSGIAFLDANKDGFLDNGETGISGVTVSLLSGTTVVATTTTGAGGAYSFTNVTPGASYSVAFGTPAGDVISTPTNPTASMPDSSRIYSNGQTGTFSVASGQAVQHMDAGYLQTASVAGIAFLDTNKDGFLDNGETGISGVTVSLLSGTTVVATTTTGAGGAYSFSNVTPGASYSVAFGTPAGDVISTPTNPTASMPDSSRIYSNGQTGTFSVASGQAVQHMDAGYVPTASVSGIAFLDSNKDGFLDNGETGISGVSVQLLNGGTVVGTTTTGAGGAYSFTNVTPGSTYSVAFGTPTGDAISTPTNPTTAMPDSSRIYSNGQTGTFSVASGQAVQHIDAGYVPSAPGLTVTKVAESQVVHAGCNATFDITVTNSGSVALTSLKLVDNIGTAANPCYVTPVAVDKANSHFNAGDTNNNGVLDVGETWKFSVTVQEMGQNVTSSGSCGYCTTSSTAYDTVTATAQTVCGSTSYNSCGSNTSDKASCFGEDTSWNSYGTNWNNGSGYGGWCGTDSYGNWNGGYGCDTSKGSGWGCDGWGHVSNGCNTTTWDDSYNTNCGYGGYDHNGNWCSGGYNTNGCGGGDANGYGGSGYGSNSNYGCGYGSSSSYSSCGTDTSSFNSWWGGSCSSQPACGTTGSTCTPTTVSGSATASVTVLGANCNSVNVTTNEPTCELKSCYGQAKEIQFCYNPQDGVCASTLARGCGTATGHDGCSTAFIVISDCKDAYSSSAHTYYCGTVAAGQKIDCDASTDLTNTKTSSTGCFSSSSQTYCTVFASQADYQNHQAAIQQCSYDTTGAHGLYANDAVGCLSVTGYVGSTGKGFLSA